MGLDQADLRQAASASVRVYDLSGRLVRSLIDRRSLPAGRHHAEWDGRNARGETVHDGVYFCRMETDAFRRERHLLLLR